jgi:hypothetical protein
VTALWLSLCSSKCPKNWLCAHSDTESGAIHRHVWRSFQKTHRHCVDILHTLRFSSCEPTPAVSELVSHQHSMYTSKNSKYYFG